MLWLAHGPQPSIIHKCAHGRPRQDQGWAALPTGPEHRCARLHTGPCLGKEIKRPRPASSEAHTSAWPTSRPLLGLGPGLTPRPPHPPSLPLMTSPSPLSPFPPFPTTSSSLGLFRGVLSLPASQPLSPCSPSMSWSSSQALTSICTAHPHPAAVFLAATLGGGSVAPCFNTAPAQELSWGVLAGTALPLKGLR